LVAVAAGGLGQDSAVGQHPRRKGRSTMQFTNPTALSKTAGYTHVVEVQRGRMIFISGQVALDGAGNIVGRGDFAAQTEQVFKNIKTALESAGASYDDVAKLTIFVVDKSQLPVFRAIRDRYVNKANPPASSLVQVSGLVRDELLIEIEAVAVIPE
jgi:enamine deaminase RidA (YjgF/YER057c/UK114 family)